jgi:hypothetical protein
MAEELQCTGSEFYELGRDLVDSGLSIRCQVRGRSMFPFLRDGDVIQVSPSTISDLCVGDIIFYRSGDHMLAHRVVGFITKPVGECARVRGDAFLKEDPPVAEEDLIGKVELVARRRRDDWRQIRLTEGSARMLGELVARSQAAHRCVRWLSRAGLRLTNGRRRLRRGKKAHLERTKADMPRRNL